MNILITNDDGIQSDGLRRLAEFAISLGQVWVVAPDGQRSAASHSITLHHSLDIYPVDFPVEGVKAFTCTGTPADCVRVGTRNLVEGTTDLVLSGINYGYNCGTDVQYSATVGAALEGASCGIPSIAVSEGASECHEVTDVWLPELLREAVDHPLERDQIWNLNFPDCRKEECRGILRNRWVAEEGFYRDEYTEEPLPGGGRRLMVLGHYQEKGAEGSDFRALVDRYISVGIVHNLR